jgi:hypothetical protein
MRQRRSIDTCERSSKRPASCATHKMSGTMKESSYGPCCRDVGFGWRDAGPPLRNQSLPDFQAPPESTRCTDVGVLSCRTRYLASFARSLHRGRSVAFSRPSLLSWRATGGRCGPSRSGGWRAAASPRPSDEDPQERFVTLPPTTSGAPFTATAESPTVRKRSTPSFSTEFRPRASTLTTASCQQTGFAVSSLSMWARLPRGARPAIMCRCWWRRGTRKVSCWLQPNLARKITSYGIFLCLDLVLGLRDRWPPFRKQSL